MKTYQVKGALHQFKTIDLSCLDLAKKLDQLDKLREICNFPALNSSLTNIWKEISVSFYSESPNATIIPDLIIWSGSLLVMSKTSYNILFPHIKNEGEFLLLNIAGEPYYIFNCLQYGIENKIQTNNKYAYGEVIGLKSLEFDEQDISKRLLFKSKKQGGSILYCSSIFKKLCNESDLEGLIFDTNLLSPFI